MQQCFMFLAKPYVSNPSFTKQQNWSKKQQKQCSRWSMLWCHRLLLLDTKCLQTEMSYSYYRKIFKDSFSVGKTILLYKKWRLYQSAKPSVWFAQWSVADRVYIPKVIFDQYSAEVRPQTAILICWAWFSIRQNHKHNHKGIPEEAQSIST